MSPESDVQKWWDAMSPDRRVQLAKELDLWGPYDDWSAPWSELLSVGQQAKIHMAVDGMLERLASKAPQQTDVVSVVVWFVNGSMQEMAVEADFLDRLDSLIESGHRGKRLINELFTDDWGAPPLRVELRGTRRTGTPINIDLHYS